MMRSYLSTLFKGIKGPITCTPLNVVGSDTVSRSMFSESAASWFSPQSIPIWKKNAVPQNVLTQENLKSAMKWYVTQPEVKKNCFPEYAEVLIEETAKLSPESLLEAIKVLVDKGGVHTPFFSALLTKANQSFATKDYVEKGLIHAIEKGSTEGVQSILAHITKEDSLQKGLAKSAELNHHEIVSVILSKTSSSNSTQSVVHDLLIKEARKHTPSMDMLKAFLPGATERSKNSLLVEFIAHGNVDAVVFLHEECGLRLNQMHYNLVRNQHPDFKLLVYLGNRVEGVNLRIVQGETPDIQNHIPIYLVQEREEMGFDKKGESALINLHSVAESASPKGWITVAATIDPEISNILGDQRSSESLGRSMNKRSFSLAEYAENLIQGAVDRGLIEARSRENLLLGNPLSFLVEGERYLSIESGDIKYTDTPVGKVILTEGNNSALGSLEEGVVSFNGQGNDLDREIYKDLFRDIGSENLRLKNVVFYGSAFGEVSLRSKLISVDSVSFENALFGRQGKRSTMFSLPDEGTSVSGGSGKKGISQSEPGDVKQTSFEIPGSEQKKQKQSDGLLGLVLTSVGFGLLLQKGRNAEGLQQEENAPKEKPDNYLPDFLRKEVGLVGPVQGLLFNDVPKSYRWSWGNFFRR